MLASLALAVEQAVRRYMSYVSSVADVGRAIMKSYVDCDLPGKRYRITKITSSLTLQVTVVQARVVWKAQRKDVGE